MPDGVDLDKLEALRARLNAELEANDTISWRKTMGEYEEALDMAAPSLIASARDLAELLAALPRCQWVDIVDGPCPALATVGAATPNPARYCDMHGPSRGVRTSEWGDLDWAEIVRRRDATE